MDSSQPNPEYISYQVYRELKEQFDRALKLETDKDTFDKILKNISYVPNKRNSGINVLTNLHNISRNDPAFLSGQGPNYCKYINFWLNKEIQNTNNRLDSSYIKIFQDFSHEFRHDRSGNYENSCKNYISNLDDETIIKMKFLYDLYDSYNEIKSQPIKDRINTCDKLDRLAISYHFSIDNYYDKDQNLYKELDNIQKLILGKIGNINPPCEKKIYFKKPINLVLQEQQALRETEEKAAREAEEKAAREAEEKAAREAEEKAAREAREKEAQKLLIEKDREQPDISLKSQDNESQEMSHGNREFQSSGYPGGTRVLGNSGLHRSTQRFGYSERSKSSRAWLLGDIHTTEEQFIQTKDDMEHQVGVDYEQPDTDRTRSGTIGGLSGFPSSITEVLGSVDPVPVVGVSGGMGALFLLFRYTPLGTFFRGGRGRVHRIPRSFNGQFLGAFPDINEYNGGNIGYGPMDIPYGAE